MELCWPNDDSRGHHLLGKVGDVTGDVSASQKVGHLVAEGVTVVIQEVVALRPVNVHDVYLVGHICIYKLNQGFI